ncbi:hypothetical protein CASFOL_034500 [Castilleja foliolosa]|uniref:Large ribosomal subunit protein uL15/eL18 domain-containing protein n=1 Tax=Castilleja foliolosa TaxID=1961234 RepID=A0ABD3BQ08_9LAMI
MYYLVAGGKSKKTKRTAPKSNDIYLKLIVRFVRIFGEENRSNFNAVVLKRLFMSRVNKAITLQARSSHEGQVEGKIVVLVGTVTDDIRLQDEVPAIKVTPLS